MYDHPKWVRFNEQRLYPSLVAADGGCLCSSSRLIEHIHIYVYDTHSMFPIMVQLLLLVVLRVHGALGGLIGDLLLFLEAALQVCDSRYSDTLAMLRLLSTFGGSVSWFLRVFDFSCFSRKRLELGQSWSHSVVQWLSRATVEKSHTHTLLALNSNSYEIS